MYINMLSNKYLIYEKYKIWDRGSAENKNMIITHRLQTWETVEEICESEKAQEIKKNNIYYFSSHAAGLHRLIHIQMNTL